jgi:hypothetical protein
LKLFEFSDRTTTAGAGFASLRLIIVQACRLLFQFSHGYAVNFTQHVSQQSLGNNLLATIKTIFGKALCRPELGACETRPGNLPEVQRNAFQFEDGGQPDRTPTPQQFNSMSD